MIQASLPEKWPLTIADVAEQLGALPVWRLRHPAEPGVPATTSDVLQIHATEKRLCELSNGLLIEKDASTYESFLATTVAIILGNIASGRRLGIVLGAGGMLELRPGLVRIPDASYISKDRMPSAGLALDKVARLVPDLAVEVISRGNTVEEMNRKLQDYFSAGVWEVWYIYPLTRELHRYRSVDRFDVLREQDEVACSVLPGLRWKLAELFAEPLAG